MLEAVARASELLIAAAPRSRERGQPQDGVDSTAGTTKTILPHGVGSLPRSPRE